MDISNSWEEQMISLTPVGKVWFQGRKRVIQFISGSDLDFELS